MPTIGQLAKSKTNEFNMVIAPAIVLILTSLGVVVPLPAVIAGYAVINFILRMVTDKALSEK